MVRVDKYGRGSAAANGEGFVDLAPGDTFAALEEQLKRRIADRFDNLALGISASIGSKRNASELAKHLAAGEEEEVHKFAAKNIGVLFVRGKLGICHDDKKAVDETRAKPKILRVFSAFEFAGSPLVATITIKPTDDGLRLYAIEALDIMRDESPEVHLAAKPRHFKTTRLLLESRIAYYVGDVNRTRPKFVGREERFTSERTVELLQNLLSQTVNRQTSGMQRQPPISFIIPVYKTPLQLLRNCLDSVLKYSQPMELICVLDSPGDPCEQVLDEYAASESRMRLLKNDRNRGVSYSRNRGMDVARGEYLAFVDADDEIVAEGYEKGAALAATENVDACAVAANNLGHCARGPVRYGDYCVGEISSENGGFLVRAFGWAVYPMLIRAEFLLKTGIRFLVGRRYGEDFMVLTKVLCAGRRFAFLNVNGYKSVGHENSVCRKVPDVDNYVQGLKSMTSAFEDALSAHFPADAMEWYVATVLSINLMDRRAWRIVKGSDRKEYLTVLQRFCVHAIVNCRYNLTGCTWAILSLCRWKPRLWFFPEMPLSFCLHLLRYLGLMIKGGNH